MANGTIISDKTLLKKIPSNYILAIRGGAVRGEIAIYADFLNDDGLASTVEICKLNDLSVMDRLHLESMSRAYDTPELIGNAINAMQPVSLVSQAEFNLKHNSSSSNRKEVPMI